MKNVLRFLLTLTICFIVGTSSFVVGVNAYVMDKGDNTMLTSEEAEKLEDVDCIIVLGCLVLEDGTPSNILEDRLKTGIELYKRGVAPKIIMSGDHSSEQYNEVASMKKYAVDAGVPSEDVFMDHAGFSTYETMYRAKEIFGAEKVVIVTQEYHLYRSVYIAEKFGMEAYGVASDYELNQSREVLARCKDFMTTIFMPKPAYLGETYSIKGNGNMTNVV
ncbi:MAG: YdcF family protein [Clostridia bacterium]|nr:YdcF family protein [Clostridia bacterium]